MRCADKTRILALASIVAFSGPLAGSARAGDDVAAAEAALAAGDARGALAAFRRLEAAPGGDADPRVEAGLGAALAATGDPAGAIPAWTVAVRKRGTTADRLGLVSALVATARDNLATGPRTSVEVVPYLRDALAEIGAVKDPDEATAARLAALSGEAYWLLGDAVHARAALAHPGLAKDPVAQDLLARACYLLGDFPTAATAWAAAGNRRGTAAAWAAAKDARAVEAYAALLRAAPRNPDLVEEALRAVRYGGLADALDAELGKPAPDADVVVRVALLRARGLLAEKVGKTADAVARYREALALAPADGQVRTDLGRALLSAASDDAKANQEAVDLLLSALAASPGDAWARKELDWLASRDAGAAPRAWPDRTRLDRAVAIFRALTAADPTDALGWGQLGNALRLAGDPKGAIAAFDQALAVNPFDATLANDRGIACLAAGDRAAALAGFEAAVALDQSDTAPRQNAGRLRWLERDDDAAEAQWGAALRSARAVGGHASLFRYLLDRSWRCRLRPDAR